MRKFFIKSFLFCCYFYCNISSKLIISTKKHYTCHINVGGFYNRTKKFNYYPHQLIHPSNLVIFFHIFLPAFSMLADYTSVSKIFSYYGHCDVQTESVQGPNHLKYITRWEGRDGDTITILFQHARDGHETTYLQEDTHIKI